jgi:hypothetical protein
MGNFMLSFSNNRDFRTIIDKELIHPLKKLINHPKKLGFKTPNQVLFGESYNVALIYRIQDN